MVQILSAVHYNMERSSVKIHYSNDRKSKYPKNASGAINLPNKFVQSIPERPKPCSNGALEVH